MRVLPAMRKRGKKDENHQPSRPRGFDAENLKTRRHQEGIITSSSVFTRQVGRCPTNIFIPMLFLPVLADDSHLNHLLKWLAAVFYGFDAGRAPPTTVNRQLGRVSRDARPHVSISLQPSYQFFNNENRALWPSSKIVRSRCCWTSSAPAFETPKNLPASPRQGIQGGFSADLYGA